MKVDSSNRLFICDSGNNRVLRYTPIENNTASFVYGQDGSFTSNTPNNGGTSASSLFNPRAIAIDLSDNLYIAVK